MSRVQAAAWLLGAAGLVACGGTTASPTPTPQGVLEVRTVDEQGAPFAVKRVWWYPPPTGTAPRLEVDATCLDAACTQWGWESPPSGQFYVAASWDNAPRGAGELACFRAAFATRLVERAREQVLVLTLPLTFVAICT